MKNVKKLSILLLTLVGTSLTACNSGAGSLPTTTSANTAVSSESVTTSGKIATTSAIIESAALSQRDQAVGARGNVGFVVTSRGDLDYYYSDKFWGKVWRFEDFPKEVKIAQVGSGTTIPTIVYVITRSHNPNDTNPNSQIHKCLLITSSATCTTIYRDKSRAYLGAMVFDRYGNGVVTSFITGSGTTNLLNFSNDKLVSSQEAKVSGAYVYPVALVDTPDANYLESLYVFGSGRFYKLENWDTRSFIPVGGVSPRTDYILSVDTNLNGYGINNNQLYSVSNGYVATTAIHAFEDRVNGISSFEDGSVYVVTSGNELKKCNSSGYCSTIDTFGNEPMAVSFKAW